MSVIAFDPGITSGIAIRADTGEYLTAAIRETTKLWEIIDRHKPTVIVFENFASGGIISKDGQATLRLIGAIEVVAFKLDIPTVLQFPQERYPFMPQARVLLKLMGRKLVSHEVDALSHLLLYESRLDRGVLDKIVANRRNTYGS